MRDLLIDIVYHSMERVSFLKVYIDKSCSQDEMLVTKPKSFGKYGNFSRFCFEKMLANILR